MQRGYICKVNKLKIFICAYIIHAEERTMEKVLVVVDYQKDFVDGALGFPGAETIESEIVKLINQFRSEGNLVLFTKDTHGENYMSTVEGQNLPIPHCISGTEGHEFTKEVDALVDNSPVFEKHTFPCLSLGNYLRRVNPKEIYLCGLVSDICVFSNAIIAKAACPNSYIYVVKAASGSPNKEIEEKAYEILNHLHIKTI